MDENLAEEYMLKWNAHNSEVIHEFHDLCRVSQILEVFGFVLILGRVQVELSEVLKSNLKIKSTC